MLKEQINADLKAAMIAKNAVALNTVRMLISALRNKEITLRTTGEAVELSDEQMLEVLSSEVKKRRDSIEAYVSGGRQDLADKEAAEIKVLEKYLPAQLSDEELEKIVHDVIETAPAKQFGVVMGLAMTKTKGQADGRRVTELVKKILSSLQ